MASCLWICFSKRRRLAIADAAVFADLVICISLIVAGMWQKNAVVHGIYRYKSHNFPYLAYMVAYFCFSNEAFVHNRNLLPQNTKYGSYRYFGTNRYVSLRQLRQCRERRLELLVGRNDVSHPSFVVLSVGPKVEVACASETEQYSFSLAGLLAP